MKYNYSTQAVHCKHNQAKEREMLYAIMSLALCVNPDTEDRLNEYFATYKGANGMVQDRASSPDIYSVAATGFGMDVWAIRSKKGDIKEGEALKWINCALDFEAEKNPQKNRGWLYHFVNSNGLPQLNSEVSTIDTAIFFWGAKQASRRLNNQQLQNKIDRAVAKIDTKWMIDNSPSHKFVCHGLRWDKDTAIFIPYEWSDNSEGVLIYRLFNIPFNPAYYNSNLPLFAYYFPMCFLPKDDFLPPLKKAILQQKDIFGYVGVTSQDTENGYQSYPKGYISPLSLYALSSFDPLASEELVGRKLSPEIHSLNLSDNWKSSDRIGIDEGAAILLRHPIQ